MTSPTDEWLEIAALRHLWQQMKQRCNNPNNPRYSSYGGRGITVCERWSGRHGFAAFYQDMGIRPKDTSLDRINNDGDYEPSNCRWATASQQQQNTRKFGRVVRFDDNTAINVYHCKGSISAPKLGKLYGVNSSSIYKVWCGRVEPIKTLHANSTRAFSYRRKLTIEDARDIRMFHAAGIRIRDMLKVYPVNGNAIGEIITYRTWKDV